MRWHYLLHLLGWALPILGVQWVVGWRILQRNLRAVFVPALVGTLFFSATDEVAVHAGVWFFDRAQVVGWWVGWLPIEEVLFFFLTSLLVSQSLVLLLPTGLRR
jgi:lycopene cyclase domain-containing protein